MQLRSLATITLSRSLRSLAPFAFASMLLVSASACKKPDPPTLVPKEAKVTDVSLAGIDLLVTIEATNPNSIPLAARSVTANVIVEKKYPLASATVPHAVSLAPNAKTTLQVPVSAKWQDLAALTALAGQQGPVHYDVDGTVNVGGDRINFDLPFKTSGVLTHEMLVKATMKSLPRLPGFLP